MFGIVIDKNGYKIEFVALNEDKTPKFYELKEGGIIIETDWNIANTMLKPQWDGSKWIETATQEELNLAYPKKSIDEIKQEKIQELNQKCNETIINGFYSDADRTKKLYDFELENQVNLSTKAYQLQIAKLAGQPITTVSYYAKGETCHDYTSDQFLKLAQDGEDWKTTNIVKYKDKLKPMVEACTTVETVNAITWDTIV